MKNTSVEIQTSPHRAPRYNKLYGATIIGIAFYEHCDFDVSKINQPEEKAINGFMRIVPMTITGAIRQGTGWLSLEAEGIFLRHTG